MSGWPRSAAAKYAAGLAEVVKRALISGGNLVGCSRPASGCRAGDPDMLAEVVARQRAGEGGDRQRR